MPCLPCCSRAPCARACSLGRQSRRGHDAAGITKKASRCFTGASRMQMACAWSRDGDGGSVLAGGVESPAAVTRRELSNQPAAVGPICCLIFQVSLPSLSNARYCSAAFFVPRKLRRHQTQTPSTSTAAAGLSQGQGPCTKQYQVRRHSPAPPSAGGIPSGPLGSPRPHLSPAIRRHRRGWSVTDTRKLGMRSCSKTHQHAHAYEYDAHRGARIHHDGAARPFYRSQMATAHRDLRWPALRCAALRCTVSCRPADGGGTRTPRPPRSSESSHCSLLSPSQAGTRGLSDLACGVRSTSTYGYAGQQIKPATTDAQTVRPAAATGKRISSGHLGLLLLARCCE